MRTIHTDIDVGLTHFQLPGVIKAAIQNWIVLFSLCEEFRQAILLFFLRTSTKVNVMVMVFTAYRHFVSDGIKLDLMLVNTVSLSLTKSHVCGLALVEVAALDVYK